MIPLDAEIFVAFDPIDLRVSFDLLSGLVRKRFGQDPKSGSLYVFFGKRREKLKALFYDKTGFCILYKRLYRVTFRIPKPDCDGDATIELPEEMFVALLEGLGGDGVKHAKQKRLNPCTKRWRDTYVRFTSFLRWRRSLPNKRTRKAMLRS
jgi:transposase